jgi:hypothetical protein
MNNLSAINNAPTLVQEIARQVSRIATMIGKVAFAALSYFVATLQAVPPLLPLMIVVVAGVTIAAIIVRNVLYPEVSTRPEAPTANAKQPDTGAGRERTPTTREKTRIRRYGAGPPTNSNGRIKTPIARRSNLKPYSTSSRVSSVFEFDSVYERRSSKEEIKQTNDLDLINSLNSAVKANPSRVTLGETKLTTASTVPSEETNKEGAESPLNLSARSSFSNNSSVDERSSINKSKRSGSFKAIRRLFEFRKHSKKGGQLTTKSENGDVTTQRSSLSGSRKKTPSTHATTDDIFSKTPRDLDALKTSFQAIAERLKAQRTAKPPIAGPIEHKDKTILATVTEREETGSTSSN